MMFKNDPYLLVVDDVFTKEFCDKLINTYNDTVRTNIAKVEDLTICKDPEGNKTCDNCDCLRVDLMQHDKFKPFVNEVAQTLHSVVDFYRQATGVDPKQFPSDYVFENLKIKRYMPDNKQGMLPHIDVFNYGSAKRFLAFIIYLNDDFEGGKTHFIKHELKVTPKPGRVVIFPPYWPWLHSAEPVLSGSPKYFLGSYLHYTD